MLHPIHPVPLYLHEASENDRKYIESEVKRIKESILPATDMSNPWGDTAKTSFKYTEESMNFLALHSLENINEYIHRHVQTYLKSLNQPDTPVEMEESWINLTEDGDFQHFHAHYESHISGSVYLESPEGAGAIGFKTPTGTISQMGGFPEMCTGTVRYFPKSGNIAMFPSWLEHCVCPNTKPNVTRISLTFNFKLK